MDGRIWSWAGDGGIIAFALRIGVDAGLVKFCGETGRIVSHVINHASHLEKKSTRPGMVSIGRNVYDALLCEDAPEGQERLA